MDRSKAKEEIGAVGRKLGPENYKEWINSGRFCLLDLVVFSDESMDEDGNVGAGYCIYCGPNIEISCGKIPLGRTVELCNAEIIGVAEGFAVAVAIL